MSICRRKDGRYAVKFKEGGRWKQRSFNSLALAQQFEAEIEYERPDNSRLTVMEAVLVHFRNASYAQKTEDCAKWLLCGLTRKNGTHSPGPAEFLAEKYVDSLTRRDLECLRDAFRARKNKNRSINCYIGILESSFNWCVEQDLLLENPWKKYKNLPENDSVHHSGTLKEFEAVYYYLPDWMQWACRTTIALCLRPGMAELFSLKWEVFNWREQMVTIYMPKVKATKNVYPPSWYLTEAKTKYLADIGVEQAYVCKDNAGKPITPKKYRYHWNSAREKAGLKIPMYALRHIAASEMLAAGADLAAVSAQLGHKDSTTTAKYYLHAMPGAQKAAANALPSQFGADAPNLQIKK